MSDMVFFGLSVIISGILFIVLAIIKNRSKFWWLLYGIIEGLIVVFVSESIYNMLKDSITELSNRIIFIIIYIFIYLLLLLFIPRSELTQKERIRIEKVNSFIFNIFLAMRQQDYDQAYIYIKNGLRVDPKNPILKQLEESFEKSDFDYKRARKKLSLKYKFVIFLRNIKKFLGIRPKVNIEDDVIDMN